MNCKEQYQYEYVDVNGVEHLGSQLHDSDQDALDYWRNLEENGGLKVKSLKHNGKFIWLGRGLKRMAQL